LHHVEALVRTARTARLDRFAAGVLRALSLGSPATLDDLEPRLHLGRQVLAVALRELASAGLVEGDATGRWQPTAAGREGLQTGSYPHTCHERRRFHFRDSGRPGQPPHFLRLNGIPAAPLPPPDSWCFDPDLLQACVAREADWKQRHGFPAEVAEVVPPSALGAMSHAPPAWKGVIVDRAEHLFVVLAAAGDELLGFAAETQGWTLRTPEPVARLGPGWEEAFPDLAEEASEEHWRAAWRAWCYARGLPPEGTESCAFRREGHVVKVTAPREVVSRWRGRGSEAFRGEAWLLAGEGPLRAAAVAEVVEATG
jgi:hypothetical protein